MTDCYNCTPEPCRCEKALPLSSTSRTTFEWSKRVPFESKPGHALLGEGLTWEAVATPPTNDIPRAALFEDNGELCVKYADGTVVRDIAKKALDIGVLKRARDLLEELHDDANSVMQRKIEHLLSEMKGL